MTAHPANSNVPILGARKRRCFVAAAAWLLLGQLAATLTGLAPAAFASKLTVVTTIAPLAMIVKDLGGDHVDVTSLVSGATSPHSYEPSPSDLARIADADLLIAIGGDLDAWLDKLLVGKKPDALVVHLLDDGVAAAASQDPHVWLDPVWVRDRALATLQRSLSEKDPATAPQYSAAARREAGVLANLEEEIRGILADPPIREFLAFHPAWNWFAARFDLHPVGAVEESGGVEPSAAALAALLDAARKARIRAILIEPQMDPRQARSFADEIGGAVVMVDPLGELGSLDRGTYRDLMLFNARAFLRALRASTPP